MQHDPHTHTPRPLSDTGPNQQLSAKGTVTLTVQQLTEICTNAMFEALAKKDRQEAIASTLADEREMVEEIAKAERGETRGRHSLRAEIVSNRLEYRILPANPSFEFQREEPPARVLGIAAEARRHLQVDLSSFLPARMPRKARSQDLKPPSQASE
ncbi:hypothetical protein [Pacificoceanicola onchidii]|uniref:hypothetical protein n=1 Tax=Pacificoceanicola onchidii TaxID=2562685 RepID=UPI001455F062|nr:hypothetical protein [Pacificoceanicola onchidii]